MTKKLILSLALAGLSSAAVAQVAPEQSGSPTDTPASSVAQAAAPTPVVGGVLAGPSPAAVPQATFVPAFEAARAQADSLVNPFNGRPLTAEQLQRELELARLRTQALEEQLKQTNTLEEIKNLPNRKAVEAAQARTQVMKEQANQRKLDEELRPPPPPPPPAPPKSEKELAREKAERIAAEKRAAKAAAELAAKTPPAKLLSVVTLGSKRSVVLDIKGNITTVADGANSPVGPVRVLSENSADVNGWTLKVHEQTLGRFVESDVALGSSGSFAPSSGAAKPSQPTVLPPPIPTPSSMPPTLPEGAEPANFTQLPPEVGPNAPSPLNVRRR